MNQQFTEKQLDLIIAALNYANLCKPVFMDHLKYHGHEDTANYADQQLERLRRKVTDIYNEV